MDYNPKVTIDNRLTYKCPVTGHDCFFGVREGVEGRGERELECEAGRSMMTANIDAVAKGAAAWISVVCACTPETVLVQGWVYV